MAQVLQLVQSLPLEKRLEFWEWLCVTVPIKVASLREIPSRVDKSRKSPLPVVTELSPPNGLVIVDHSLRDASDSSSGPVVVSHELAEFATFLQYQEVDAIFRDTTLGVMLWDTYIAPSLHFGTSQDKNTIPLLLDELFHVPTKKSPYMSQVATFHIPPMAPKGVNPRAQYLGMDTIKTRCELCGVSHECSVRLHLQHKSLVCGSTCGARFMNLANMLVTIVSLRARFAMNPKLDLRTLKTELSRVCDKITKTEFDRVGRYKSRYKNTPFARIAEQEAQAVRESISIDNLSVDEGTDSEAGVSEAELERQANFIVPEDDAEEGSDSGSDSDSEWVPDR